MAKVNPFRFSTKYQDDETDLLYYGYRYYNASTGRWANHDLISEDGGLNLYGFAANSPTFFTDRNGLDFGTWIGAPGYNWGTPQRAPSTPQGPRPGPAVGDVGTSKDFPTAITQAEAYLNSYNNSAAPADLPPDFGGFDRELGQLEAFNDRIQRAVKRCTCRVFVVCRPLGLKVGSSYFNYSMGVQGTAAGLATLGRAKHCFLLLVDNCGGSSDGVGKSQVITLGAKPRNDYATAFNKMSEYHEVGTGCKLCESIRAQAPRYNTPVYNKNGPNSNTFIKELLRSQGLPDPNDGDVPWGWNYENPNPVWN